MRCVRLGRRKTSPTCDCSRGQDNTIRFSGRSHLPRTSHPSPDGGGFSRAAVDRLAADGDDDPPTDPIRKATHARSSIPFFLTTEHTEHTETNTPTGMSSFRVFRVFRGSTLLAARSREPRGAI